jgi:DNA-binding response OmpR family regulator
MLSRSIFDLVFIDINLGDWKDSVLASPSRSHAQAQIVFATAIQICVRAFEIGVDHYILNR